MVIYVECFSNCPPRGEHMTPPPPLYGLPARESVGPKSLVSATRRGVAGVGVGWVGLAWSPRGLALITSLVATAETARQWLDALSTGPRPLVIESAAEPAAAALAAYLAGEPLPYRGPVDLSGLSPFAQLALAEVRRIPYGETRTYGWLARRMGQPQAARAAGRAIGVNPLAPLIPCHRVVGANGSLTGYRWGIALKRWLLALEGVCLPD